MMNMSYDDVVDAFKSGTLYGVNAGTQRAATILESSYADNFDTCPMPGVTADDPAPHIMQDRHLQ